MPLKAIYRAGEEKKEIVHFDQLGEAAVCTTPPTSFQRHWHLSAEFVFALKDNLFWEINNVNYDLKQGDILIIWPTDLHSVISEPENSAYILQFPSTLIDSCSDLSMALPYLRRHHYIEAAKFTDANPKMFSFMEDILECVHSNRQFKGLEIRIYIYALLLEISKILPMFNQPEKDLSDYTNSTHYKINEACTYLSQHYQEDISLKEIAKLTGYSPHYFSRIFHQLTSMTFKEYVSIKRIQSAITLLIESDAPVTEIAYQVGFQSISNFNKVFKKMMRCSPLEYRKMYDDKAHSATISSPLLN